MRNLKRALSLVLAAAMLVGMMVVGASAAGYDDFTDKSEIVNTEAVATLVALNVINGKEDGSYFDPTGMVTRAEMAKMITVALHGGKDPVLGVKDKASFTDIKGTWAESYIEYCTSDAVGVISGRGDGTFDPTATVTAAEAAKMLLVAMGYKADVFKLTGASWQINTDVYANQAKLYDELNITSSAKLSRDNAAQMIFNAIQSPLMERSWTQDQTTGKITESYHLADGVGGYALKTILTEKFNAVTEYTYLTGATYDADKKVYTYSYNNGASFGGAAIDSAVDLSIPNVKSASDYSALFGQKVKVLYKNDTAKTIYGIYAVDSTAVASGALGLITSEDGLTVRGSLTGTETSIKLGGSVVKLDGTVNSLKVYTFNNSTAMNNGTPGSGDYNIKSLTGVNAYSMVEAIDNNGNGKADCFVVYPTTAAKVSYVGTGSITAGSNFLYNKDADNHYVSGTPAITYKFPTVTKDSYVLIPDYGVAGLNREVSVVEKFEGKVEGLSAVSAQVNGTWYWLNSQSIGLGNTYELAAVNGFLVGSKLITATSKDIAMVLAEDAATTLTGIRAKLMFADGTQEVVEVSKVNDTPVTTGNTLATSSIAAGSLVTYTKAANGTYEVKDLSASNLAGYGSYKPTANDYTAAVPASSTPAKLGGELIADDAVIFVKYAASGTPKYTVISGADLKAYGNITSTGEALMSAANGINSVKVATLVTNDTTFSSSNAYGYVLTAPYAIKEGTTTLYTYDVWTADGKLTVKDTANNSLVKGNVITFTANNDGTVTSSKDLDSVNGGEQNVSAVSITGYSESDKLVTMNGTSGAYYGVAGSTPILDTTKILFVDTKNHVGAEGGEIALAQATANGGYFANAKAFYANGKLELLIVDTNNNLGGANTECGYTVAAATLAGTTTGYTIATDKTKAVQGEIVTVTITSDGSGAQTSAATTVAGGSVTVGPTTLTASTAGSYNISFAVGNAAPGAITVTLS